MGHILQLNIHYILFLQFQLSYNQQVKEFNEGIRQFNEEIARLKKKDEQEYKFEIQRLELQKQQMEQAKKEAERDYQIKQQQLAEQVRSNKASESISWYNATTSRSASTGGSPSYAVQTAYYQGDLNADANKFGTMANGYQPKGISGHGTLKKAGDTITFKTQTLSGQSQTVTQNIWKAEDGTKWYWDGTKNSYIQIKK